jgi:hypothetical protein
MDSAREIPDALGVENLLSILQPSNGGSVWIGAGV